MYAGIKSKIRENGKSSEIFNCNAGVRQGKNLSSFSLYINNLDRYLIEKGISGLEKISKDIEDDFSIFMKLFKFCM